MTESKYFGELSNGRKVSSVTISSKNISAEIIDHGASIRSLHVPDMDGIMRDVVLGYDSPDDYHTRSGKIGTIVGRCAGRISNSSFMLNGKKYMLYPNSGKNHIHGGKEGFDRKIWEFSEVNDDSVLLTLVSEDGEEGYPGRLTLSVRYTVHDGSITIDYKAVSDSDTVCNPTNHSYFNLASEGNIDDHKVKISSDSILEANEEGIPSGKTLDVSGTSFDLRTPKLLGDAVFDNVYVLKNKGKIAEVCCDRTGIKMTVSTNMPSVVFYTAGNLKDCIGKNGMQYGKRSGLCLETQFYPDSPNHPEFPSCILRKGEEYGQRTTYSFSVQL